MPPNVFKPLTLLCCIAASSLADEGSYSLEVKVTGAKPETGQLLLSLFDSEENYLKEPILEHSLLVNTSGEGVFLLESLASGFYAVSVIYDEDVDNELDTGLFGIPKEKIGMSNNARGRFGPPSYDETRFELKGNERIDIFLDAVSD